MNVDIDLTGVELKTERLVLRPFNDDDLKDFNEYARVDGVGQMAGWLPHENLDVSRTILNDFINGKKTFALVYEGKTIGSLGLEKYKEDEFPELADLRMREIGYVLNKDYWGRGLMPEAVKEVIRYAFEELKLDALMCGCFLWNKQSKRVIEKCGFKHYAFHDYKTRYDTIEKSEEHILYREEWEKK